jgi:hypothetical protein
MSILSTHRFFLVHYNRTTANGTKKTAKNSADITRRLLSSHTKNYIGRINCVLHKDELHKNVFKVLLCNYYSVTVIKF